nr:alpha-amylase family glycosyl hydrolase [Anaerolineae bacterium]
AFTYRPEIGMWVWTTFYSFQWDLNYSNPAVFNAMLGEMLYLANQGVEVLRLDAVAFIWKQMGTACESLPQAHWIIQAFNALTRIAAPALLFKSEAIVHPDDVASYVSWEESPVSYNPTLMALLWESLATRKVALLQQSMAKRFALSEGCAWVNYVRVHDDIGWTFANEDATELGMIGFDHRLFLNAYYTGEFMGSFARGLPFNFNPATLDMRISGTAASLAGLETSLERADPLLLDEAVKRLLLIHSVIISAGGIPLIYLGDEIATLNDYSYRDDPEKKGDSRWVHRPRFSWQRAEQRHDLASPVGRVYQGLKSLLDIRVANPIFAGANTLFFNTGNPHVLGYLVNRRLLVLANFSEKMQSVQRDVLAAYAPVQQRGVSLLTRDAVHLLSEVALPPLAFSWILYD